MRKKRTFFGILFWVLKGILIVVFTALVKIIEILVQIAWVLLQFAWSILEDVFVIILDILRTFDRFGIINLLFGDPNENKKDK